MASVELNAYERRRADKLDYGDELQVAPWLIDESYFSVHSEKERVETAMAEIKRQHSLLVLASSSGLKYGTSILADFDGESLSIDKPINFDEISESFLRIFFQDSVGVWCFCEVEIVDGCSASLCTSFPVMIHRLQKRCHRRIGLPEGARALFRQDGDLRCEFSVKNISASGMLVCSSSEVGGFDPAAEIDDIFLILPKPAHPNKNAGRCQVVLSVADKGKVARSVTDLETGFVYHGISYPDGSDVMNIIRNFIDEAEGGHCDE